jgi:hypothetical protein
MSWSFSSRASRLAAMLFDCTPIARAAPGMIREFRVFRG